jgi:predicted nuclease of restriction endonuclease-like (RecB) superfamily
MIDSFDEIANTQTLADAVAEIKNLMLKARSVLAVEINQAVLQTNWEIGRIIVEVEQSGSARSEYGSSLLKVLSRELTAELGRGFSRVNLQNMRKVYQLYPICQSLIGKLTWTHYLQLITISDPEARSFYEKEAINSNWSVRTLRREIESSLFERLLLSNGKASKERVLALAQQGVELAKPEDILKRPYVFDFIGNRENKPILERDLEKRLIRHIEDFLLELGRGFMFVGSQYRMHVNTGDDYYADMVFYNKILRAYVVIDLKRGRMKPEYAGQMNAYLNYIRTEVNDDNDNDPVGIILCGDSNRVDAEFALGGISNQVFASSYVYYIPDKETLVEEVKYILAQEEDTE